MFVFRVLLPLFAAALGGFVIAWFVTKDRKYLVYAWRLLLGGLVLVVAFGLLYVFERVLLL
jgi:hypothetical protein